MLKAQQTYALCGLSNIGQIYQVTDEFGNSRCYFGKRDGKIIVFFQKTLSLTELEETTRFLRQECLEPLAVG